MKPRTICVATGSRAEYGYLRPVMRAIRQSKRLRLKVALAGMHLRKEFGATANYIRADGFHVDAAIPTHQKDDTGYAMAVGVGEGIRRFAAVFQRMRPDIVLVLGDRVEPFAATVASAFQNIPVAHIHGGDRAQAGFDDFMRHAITKFAHIHFPATRKSRERIIKLGENPAFVFQTGSPSLDEILNMSYMTRGQVETRFGVDFKHPVLILLQHSVSTQWKDAIYQMRQTLQALKILKHQTIVIYPNSDAGGQAMIRLIEKEKGTHNFKMYKSLSRLDFLSLMRYGSALVGNSSSGMIESASFKIPVVNIGIRQKDRERGINVFDVPHRASAIVSAINTALSESVRRRLRKCISPYGDGQASQRIVRVLERISIDRRLLEKQISY